MHVNIIILDLYLLQFLNTIAPQMMIAITIITMIVDDVTMVITRIDPIVKVNMSIIVYNTKTSISFYANIMRTD